MSLAPLLNRPAPYPDETLASWFRRLAHQNYIDPSSLLRILSSLADLRLSGQQFGTLNWLRDEAMLSGLAHLSQCSIMEIYRHTFHRFAAQLVSPGQQVDEADITSDTHLTFWPQRPTRDVYSPQAGWCPGCLSEARYVRQHWHMPISVSCEVHRCWLFEQCPGCDNWTRDEDILSGQCQCCGCRLAEADPMMIPNGDLVLQMQAALMNWLGSSANDVQLGLPDVPPGALLEVWVGLRYAAQRTGNGWHFHHIPEGIPVPDLDIVKMRSLTQFERGCLYATAFRGLLDWPWGFFAYLDAYRLRPEYKERTGLRREFGVLHTSWFRRLWKHPDFDFVQAAYNDYLVTRVPAHRVVMSQRIQEYPELLERVEYLSLPLAKRLFGISTRTLDRLGRQGHLTIHRYGQSDDRWLLRSELVQLQQRWDNHLTTVEAGALLGTSGDITRELVGEGLIQPVPEDSGIRLKTKNYIYRNSVPEFIQKLKSYTTIRAFDGHTGMSLSELSVRGGGAGFGSAELLKLVSTGNLPAYHPDETLFPLSDLWFSPEVVENFARIVKEEQGWMTLTETQHFLDVKRVTVQHYVATNQLQPVYALGQKQFFRRRDVLALQDRSLLPEEAALILNTGTSSVLSLALQGVLPVMSGPGINNGNTHYRFDRSQLLRWQKKYVLLGELRRMFGSTGLQKTLKTNCLKPVTRSPQVYRRKEVMPILEKHFSRL